MRLGCILPLVSIALIVGGGQSVYTGLKNRKATEIGIDAFVASKPAAEWLRIQGGVLDTTNSAYPSTFGKGEATSIYVPLVPPGTDSSEATIHVLVLTKDPQLLEFTNQARKFDDSTATAKGAAEEFLLKNLDKLHVARPVEGLVQFGIEANDKRTRKIRKLYGNLADDAIILEEGKTPATGTGFAMLAGGLVLGAVLVFSGGRKQAPAGGGVPPPLPPQ